jgi:hypothetical protein
MAEKAEWVVPDPEALGQPSKGPSNAFEPAGDCPSNLVRTILWHEVETSDDDAVLVREAARQALTTTIRQSLLATTGPWSFVREQATEEQSASRQSQRT